MGTLKWNCEAKRGRGGEKLPDQNQDTPSKSGTGTALYLFFFSVCFTNLFYGGYLTVYVGCGFIS